MMNRRSRRWQKRLLRSWPRRRHLRGSRLHRLLGERLFRPELWAFSRRSVAGGLALGVFIGCTPTVGIQIVLAGLAAYFLRVNIPIALIGTLVSNPFTVPILFPLEYQLGLWMVGFQPVQDVAGLAGAVRRFVAYTRPLWVGSLVFAVIGSLAAWGVANLAWWVGRAIRRKRRHRPRPNAGGGDSDRPTFSSEDR